MANGPVCPVAARRSAVAAQHLGPQRRAWPEQIDDSLKNYPAEIQHAAEDHLILRLMPTGWNLRQGLVSEIVFKCCPYRKLNPHVLMMQPTKDGPRFDTPSELNDPSNRCILA